MPLRQTPAFATLLKRYRQAAGLTQEALASRAGLSVRAISDLERGLKVRPHKDTVALLAAALQLSPAEHAAFVAARQGSAPPVAGTEPAPFVGRCVPDAIEQPHTRPREGLGRKGWRARRQARGRGNAAPAVLFARCPARA